MVCIRRWLAWSILLLGLLNSMAVLAATPEGWAKPFPAFRVIGNLYGVGTHDLSVFLITSDEGHILINTGLEDSTAQIRANVESLGFRLEDVRILLSQQAHWDHTAALAEIRALSGAEMWGTAKDRRILEDGGFSDPHFGGRESFKPIAVDRVLYDGDVIELGDIRLTVHDHPGHTEGSSSYSMVVREGGRDYRVLIANMGTINEGKRLLVEPTYPGVADDFARTYREQKAMAVACTRSTHPDNPTVRTPSSTRMVSAPRWKGWRPPTWRSSRRNGRPATADEALEEYIKDKHHDL